MRFLKRAFLSVLYYWKTVLLLVVLFTAIATLLLSGLCIKDSAQKQTVSIRRSLGGSVTLSAGQLDSMGNPKKPLPLAEVTKIAKLAHVKSSVFVISCSAQPQGFKTVTDGNSSVEKGSVLLVGVNDSSLHEEFTQGELTLKSGRALHENDLSTSNTVISEDFAKLNKLKPGDTVVCVSNQKNVCLKIVGIFAQKQADNKLNDNSMYVPYTVVHNITGKAVFFHAVYTIDDPLYIDAFRNSVVKLEYGINLSQLNASDYAYGQLSGPINDLGYISSVMVCIMLIAGAIIFSLIVLLSLRGRKYEIGVLLSIGEKKRNIIAQLAVESLVPILIAFSLSIGTGNIAAQAIGNVMFATQTNSQSQTVSNDGRTYTASNKIIVNIMPREAGFLYLEGLLIALVSVTVSSIAIMRYRPKDILAQNE